MRKIIFGFIGIVFLGTHLHAQINVVDYTIGVKDTAKHLFHIEIDYVNKTQEDSVSFYLPKWTPGYYQIMDFAASIRNLKFENDSNETLKYTLVDSSHWIVPLKKGETVHIGYDMLENKNFVAESYVDGNRAYILPTNLFLYNEQIQFGKNIRVKVLKDPSWPNIYGTGLSLQKSDASAWTFAANTLDDFYDSPILLGRLDSLPTFYIHGIVHQFVGYDLGNNQYTRRLMSDMKKIITLAIDIFQDIPYKKYVFLGIGEGRGGIEHLNSSSVSFSGNSIKNENDYKRVLSFLTHEYFHNFNVKRIRPIELGPFDYQTANRTRQLWISEGLSVYYENWLLYKTGIYSQQEFLNTFTDAMDIYENKPGHLIQSLASSSWNTWSDGPFGNLSDTAISYYDKGPVIGLLFDCEIKYYSKGKFSLENVMRALYDQYYKKLGRGFTEEEFKSIATHFGTKNILPLFEYINTAKEVDYNKYLNLVGLKLNYTIVNSKKIYQLTN